MTQKDNPMTPDIAAFIALETKVWQALVDGDADADGAMLTPGFLGVYPSGFAGRSDHTGQLADGPVMQRYVLSDARLLVIGPEHALLCYRAGFTRAGSDRAEAMFISSLWESTDTGWRNSFSQDTPAADH